MGRKPKTARASTPTKKPGKVRKTAAESLELALTPEPSKEEPPKEEPVVLEPVFAESPVEQGPLNCGPFRYFVVEGKALSGMFGIVTRKECVENGGLTVDDLGGPANVEDLKARGLIEER